MYTRTVRLRTIAVFVVRGVDGFELHTITRPQLVHTAEYENTRTSTTRNVVSEHAYYVFCSKQAIELRMEIRSERSKQTFA